MYVSSVKEFNLKSFASVFGVVKSYRVELSLRVERKRIVQIIIYYDALI